MSIGKPIGNLFITLDLDSSKLSQGLQKSKNAIKHHTTAMNAQVQAMNASGNRLGALQAKYDGLNNVLKYSQNHMEALIRNYKKSFDESGNATKATMKYADQINKTSAEQARYIAQMKETAGAYAELKTKTTGVTGAINKTSEVLGKAGTSMQNVGSSLTRGVTLPIAGAVTAVTTAAVKWESAFAGVKKTNDEIVDSNGNVVYSYSDLEKSLRDLAKELPASHEEIAGVAEAAGQLGIQTDNVVSFTKTMIDLGESTNMSAETAATSLARFANITQMSQKDFERLGAVVVDLGNNLATTESEITEMGLRLAGAGKQVGMSQAEIMSFAAALSSVGIEAEAGGTAFSKVMVQMQLAVEKGVGALEPLKQTVSRYGYSWEQFVHAITWGGKELTDLSKKIGISSKDLKKMYKNASESAGSLEQAQQKVDEINQILNTASENHRSISENERKKIAEIYRGLSTDQLEILGFNKNQRLAIENAYQTDLSKLSYKELRTRQDDLQSALKEEKKAYEKQKESLREIYKDNPKALKENLDQLNIEYKNSIQDMIVALSKVMEEQGHDISQLGDYWEKYGLTTEEVVEKVSEKAKKNAEVIGMTADETSNWKTASTEAAKLWNSLVFDEQTAEIKSNVEEVIIEATKNSETWKKLQWVVHDVNLDTNARTSFSKRWYAVYT